MYGDNRFTNCLVYSVLASTKIAKFPSSILFNL